MLTILYQDEHIVAINKPSGLLVHRSMIDRHETRFAVQMTRDLIGQKVYTVHRLDKPTSGVLLFALSRDVARQLTQQFTAAEINKTYTAIVRGYIDDEGEIDHALKEQLDDIADAQADQNKAAQTALTHYRCLARVELPYPVGRYQTARYSQVELKPKTGRRHQLRRHMKHISHPIVGDTTHGDGRQNTFFRDQYQLERLLLHASELTLQHPITQQTITLTAGMPSDMSGVLSALWPTQSQ